MEDHTVFCRQAEWTRDLRAYAFQRAAWTEAQRVLEVGCGTGAILGDGNALGGRYGLDIRLDYLREARSRLPAVHLTCGDACALPYPQGAFDGVFCHYFLLWVSNPLVALLEVKRVTRSGGWVLALAEPDYAHRLDRPFFLVPLGRWQRRALRQRGADPDLGSRLGSLFWQAGLLIVEEGLIQPWGGQEATDRQEWAILENDLVDFLPAWLLRGMRSLEAWACRRGKRRLFVPTHFALGRVP